MKASDTATTPWMPLPPTRLAPVVVLRGCVPGVVVRLVPAIAGAALTFVAWQNPVAWAGALVLVIVMLALPRQPVAWLLLLLLAFGQVTRDVAVGWRFFVLLAGLHLLHLLACQAAEVPLRGWVHLGVFARPLARFVAIQIPCQAIAFGALTWLAPDADGHRPYSLAAFGVIGGAALVVVAIALAQPLLRGRARFARHAMHVEGPDDQGRNYG